MNPYNNCSNLALNFFDSEYKLSQELLTLQYGSSVTHLYNPIEYAKVTHIRYLQSFLSSQKPLMLMGMNPGPWGMGQTGVSTN